MEKELEKWKEKHGKVVEINVAEQSSYFREPSLAEFSIAQATSQGDNMNVLNALMEQCFLGGFDYRNAQGFSAQMAYVGAFSKFLEPQAYDIKNV